MGAREIERRLLDETGIATVAGTSFGEFGEGFIRFSYAASRDAIEDAMTRLGEWLARQDNRRASAR